MIFVGIVLAALVVSALLLLFAVFPSRRRHKDLKILDGRFIAHRGLHNIDENIPENSLAAFRKAAEQGFAIENDIHITKDGEVVVFHDDDLQRVCNVSGKIEEMTLAQLKKCRLSCTDERIPTLRECLQEINGRVPLLIEFKCTGLKCRALCEAADKILSEYKGEYLIQSFYPTVLRWYKSNRKSVCRGQLATAFKGEPLYKRMLGCLMFNFLGRPDFVSYEHEFADKFMRRFVTRLGAYPVGWTFKSRTQLLKNGKYFKAYIFENFIPKQ